MISHISLISPRDIERIVRMGLVLTTHTNNYIYKGLRELATAAAAGAPPARSSRCARCWKLA